jgi:hypothetical protein
MRFDSIVKFLGSRNFIIFIVLLILILGFYLYSKSKSSTKDYMGQGTYNSSGSSSSSSYSSAASSSPSSADSSSAYMQPQQPPAMDAEKMITPPQNSNQVVQPQGGYAQQPVANPSDLLPADKNSQWSTLNPSLSQNNVIVPDLLEAGYHIGLDTIGQTLRNANLQERSDPVIPKQEISPWNNSTIEPDLGRVPLELGYGCR